MDVISYEYTKQRKEFGKHPTFADSKLDLCSVPPDEAHASNWVTRKSTTVELDCIPSTSAHWVNTERIIPAHRGMSHTTGGWPWEENKTNEMQAIERFLGQIEIKKEYQTSVRRMTRMAEAVVQQNNTIDLYEEYFDEPDVDVNTEAPSAKTISVLRDPNNVKRAATKLCWHPDGSSKLAVSYSVLQFQQMPDDMPASSYIWDVNSPNAPEFEIIPQSPLTCLKFNPRTPDHLVGGSYNGLVAWWDLRKGNQPVEMSVIEKSHHDPVTDVFWVQSRTGNECVSSSTDGQLLWWDIRKLSAGPTDTMQLQGPTGVNFGGTCLEYRTDAGATRYLVGTEQGQMLLVDRKAKKDAESTKSIKTAYGIEAGRHHGPVYGLQRHPFSPKYFMTVGDWTTRVWMEDLKTPIMTTKYDSAYLSAGCWSPTRPGVLFTTKVDGTLDVWDFFFKQNDPTFSTKIGDSSLASIAVHSKGNMLALGSQDGTTTILQISDSLVEPQPNEKQAIVQMFERETKREKHLEIRFNQKKRERTSGRAKAQPDDKKDKAEQEAKAKKDSELDALLEKVEADFFLALDMADPATLPQEGDPQYEDDFSEETSQPTKTGVEGQQAEATGQDTENRS